MTLPQTHGDVTAEYRAARYGVGAVRDLYELVWFSGDDAVSFLEGLISQNVEAMDPGTVRRSFLLGPQGKLLALLWVLRDTDRVGLVTDVGYARVVVDTLGRYRIRVDVTIEEDERSLTTLVGPESPEVEGWSAEDATLVAGLPMAGNRRSITTADPDAEPVGAIAWRAIRVEAGEPVMGADVDESTIPQESGLVPASVDLEKGCFLGQELVARIDSRGRVNRMLRGVMVLTNVLPPHGADIVDGDGTTVGSFTSPAESLALRSPVGMGLIRHEVSEGDSVTVRWDGGEAPAAVAALPMIG